MEEKITQYAIFDIDFSGSEISFSIKVIGNPNIKDLVIEDESLTVNPGDSIYFTPKVSIPRVKVKNLTIDYAAKITRDIDKADIIIIPENLEHILYTYSHYYTIDKNDLLDCFNSTNNIDTHDLEKLNDVLDTYPDINFATDWHGINRLSNVFPSYNFYDNREYIYINSVSTHFYEIYEDLKNKTLYKESLLLKRINGDDALVITKEVYEQLRNMFCSSDSDNYVLAMEMMANCKYIDSILYLELLFKEFSYKMRTENARNHVNFKSLCKFLGKENNRYMNTDFDDIINSLIKHDKASLEYLTILVNKFYKDLFSEYSKFIEVKSLTLSKDLLESVNTNYVHEIVEDYIPKKIEKQPKVVEEEVVQEVNSETVKWI